MSATYTLRPPMALTHEGVRAYFAPVARASEAPVIFDPAAGMFDFDGPPAPWLDLGWIASFQRSSATKFGQARGGSAGAVAAQFRGALDARVEFEFREWGKLQMALAGGSQHMNVLAPSGGAAAPSGGAAVAAVALAPGSTASQIVLGSTSGFAVGDLVVCDIDYTGQLGYVGSGIAGAFVASADSVQNDADYIRRVSFNVARVASLTPTMLTLAQPLLGGTPDPAAKIQKVIGFVDREGGSFFQEWSALFVLPEVGGGRVCYHYPRLQACAPAEEKSYAIADTISGAALRASFVALPFTDPLDGETAVCYRSFFPAASAAIY